MTVTPNGPGADRRQQKKRRSAITATSASRRRYVLGITPTWLTGRLRPARIDRRTVSACAWPPDMSSTHDGLRHVMLGSLFTPEVPLGPTRDILLACHVSATGKGELHGSPECRTLRSAASVNQIDVPFGEAVERLCASCWWPLPTDSPILLLGAAVSEVDSLTIWLDRETEDEAGPPAGGGCRACPARAEVLRRSRLRRVGSRGGEGLPASVVRVESASHLVLAPAGGSGLLGPHRRQRRLRTSPQGGRPEPGPDLLVAPSGPDAGSMRCGRRALRAEWGRTCSHRGGPLGSRVLETGRSDTRIVVTSE